ncbi:MAG: DUF6785 family protein [Candidatus Bathyarchaeia archaeon]
MSKEVIEEKISLPLWIIVGLITLAFGLLGPLWVSTLVNATWYAPGRVACKLVAPVLPLILILITASIGRFLRKRINPLTYVILYATGMGLIIYTSSDSFPIGSPFPNLCYDRLDPIASQYIPLFLAPPENVASILATGGPINWSAWSLTILWWWLFLVGYALTTVSAGTIFKNQWIDVERVPFPHTIIVSTLMDKFKTQETSLIRKFGLPLFIGLALGVIFQLPLFLAYLYPWFPDIYGFRINTCTHGAQWITPDSPLASIVGFAQFNKDPLLAAIFYMAPLDILFSGWFFYLVFVILMQVAYTMGYYTGIEGLSGCGRVWCGTISYRVGEPFKWDVFGSAGLTTGMFIMYMILNRRYVINTLKAALGILPEAVKADLEKDLPLSYRNLYLIFLVGVALLAILLSLLEIPFEAIVTLLVCSCITTFIASRNYSLVGFVVPAGSYFYYGPIKAVLGESPEILTRGWVSGAVMTYGMVNEPITGGGYAFPFVASLASYRLASYQGVSSKTVFKILLPISVIAPLLTLLGAVWGFHTFGITKLPTASGSWWSAYNWLGNPSALARRPAYPPWWPHMLAGVVVAIILGYLHARFLWFPLDPIGFLLAVDGHALVEGIWTMLLVAWVLKTITLRIGGSKLYEERGIPAAIGFATGMLIVAFVGGIILAIRFFVPF